MVGSCIISEVGSAGSNVGGRAQEVESCVLSEAGSAANIGGQAQEVDSCVLSEAGSAANVGGPSEVIQFAVNFKLTKEIYIMSIKKRIRNSI